MKKQPTTEQLEQIRDQLREEIREARGTLKDLRAEIRTARRLLPELAAERISSEVATQLARLGDATTTAMEAAVNRVNAKFDELYDIITGQDHASRRAGEPSIPDLIRARAQVDREEL
ncbi:hypothetical protein AB0P17_36480 [Streptomyces sp. NPDC088124]|uniref:hypothetical protein n=1 Tax=Streptomyces sp. NPDC088124 TaxID=3154654 RepID=UPI00344986E1